MKIKLNHTNVFFISDTHLGHANIIKYDNRPFQSIEEHDNAIIRNWNNVVGQDDVVFHLGDFSMKNGEKYISRLSGRIHLLRGNHDKQNYIGSYKFYDYVDLNINEQHLCLFHYPVAEWNRCHHGSILLYGHTHGNSWFDKEFQQKYKCLNVGANLINYTPISYNEIQSRLKNKEKLTHH